MSVEGSVHIGTEVLAAGPLSAEVWRSIILAPKFGGRSFRHQVNLALLILMLSILAAVDF